MDYDASTFGKRFADSYDDGERSDTPLTVDVLLELARGGPALELAIGTGRVGLALANKGIRVDGIEASPEMVAKLRAKPGGAALDITIGDYADVGVHGTYRLIFLVYNTLSNLTTQDDQVRCFGNVAEHLADDGVFVVEAGVPGLAQLQQGQYVQAEQVDLDEVVLDVSRIDVVTQRWEENHVHLTAQGIRLNPVVTRYTWPSEMDLMARLAGLRVHERWSDWNRAPFTRESTSNIVVYGW